MKNERGIDMNIDNKRKNIISSCLFVVEVVLLFIMTSFFFPGCDEIDFQNWLQFSNLSEFLHHVIYFGNGRFLGNMISIFFSFYPDYFFLLEPVFVALICVFTEKLVGIKYARHLVLGFFMLKPIVVFTQMLPRIAMFSNYYLPLLFMIATLIIIKKSTVQNRCPGVFLCIALFALGFFEQLFVESNTVVNIVLSFLILIYFTIKKKSKTAPVILFISNILGALPILLYSFYINMQDTFTYSLNSGYRKTIFSGGLSNAIEIWATNAKYPIYYFSLFIFFFVVCMALLIYSTKKFGVTNRQKALMIFSGVSYTVLFAYIVYIQAVYVHDIPSSKELPLMLLLVLLFLIAYVPLFIMIASLVIKRCRNKIVILTSLLMGFISYAPFLAASPSGYRCCEQMFFFFILALLLIFRDISAKDENASLRAAVTVGMICCVSMALYSYLYAEDKKVYEYREQYCYTSYYLPEYSFILSRGDNVDYTWEDRSGMRHEYIPVEEFEKMLENSEIK